ncbi:hypothetical protein GJ496_010598 [Pomphorhynchus laevis]|nr:hypothetical protein GJ496_010598 [Pomphorhynchus laevis]
MSSFTSYSQDDVSKEEMINGDLSADNTPGSLLLHSFKASRPVVKPKSPNFEENLLLNATLILHNISHLIQKGELSIKSDFRRCSVMYLNVKTIEDRDYCIELRQNKVRIVGKRFNDIRSIDAMDADKRKALFPASELKTYPTIYEMLSAVSQTFKIMTVNYRF